MLKKKIITVVLDTDHDVALLLAWTGGRACCRSYTTGTAEVAQCRQARRESVEAPDTGYGFLWRLNTYWRFLDRDGGVYLECRAISLTATFPVARD